MAPQPMLLENLVHGPVRTLAQYRVRAGGRALAIASELQPGELIALVSASGLRGRGGAGFPAGRKWSAVRGTPGRPVLVVNADEGDPGTFSDKVLMEDDPFRLIEGIGIAACAIGASEALIYLRCEYPRAAEILHSALLESRTQGWPAGLNITLHSGRGSYVCGEETALLNALEQRRPFARARPPYPFERGLYGRPTLVHNVETLCALPSIVLHGSAGAATKLVSLSSLFRHPGLVEIPFGYPLRDLVDEVGGGLRHGRLLGLMIGGPLAGLLPPEVLDTPFTYEDLTSVGGSVGHGGVIAFADDTPLAGLIGEVFRFGASESCGLCVPCHLGTAELAAAFADVSTGRTDIGRTRWDALINALEAGSLCGHGSGIAAFARSLERHYPEALAACLNKQTHARSSSTVDCTASRVR